MSTVVTVAGQETTVAVNDDSSVTVNIVESSVRVMIAPGRGPQGIQGEAGPQGDTGPQGIQGDTGPQGDQYFSAVGEKGGCTTGASLCFGNGQIGDFPVPVACTLDRIAVRCVSTNANMTFEILKNGVATGVTVAIVAGDRAMAFNTGLSLSTLDCVRIRCNTSDVTTNTWCSLLFKF